MASSSEGDTVKPTNTNKSTSMLNPLAPTKGARKRRRLESQTTNSEVPKKTQRRDEPCDSDVETFSQAEAEPDARESQSSRRKRDQTLDARGSAPRTCETARGGGDAARLRKTIQWLEQGARRLRDDLANVRTELHEERRAAKMARREFEAALKEARLVEAAKYQPIIAELRTRVAAHSTWPPSPSSKSDPVKDENHKRESLPPVPRRRSAGTENPPRVRRLEWQSVKSPANGTRGTSASGHPCGDARRLEAEVRSLRVENEKLEEKLRMADKTRISEIRAQRENHEAELSALRKLLRNETAKMMDELRGKSREIEKLSKLLRQRTPPSPLVDHDTTTMRKMQENERNRPTRASASRTEKKIVADDGHPVGSYVRAVESDRAINEIEVERLRELALEQQEVIEILRQAVKERERKLEQLSNKRKKEEFYKQWLELEPVAEVDDEEDHEDDDSALSSAPSSMSPQPGGYSQWQGNGVTREAYEAVLVEVEELQAKLLGEQRELSRAKVQICDLEKALLQERCADRDRELSELADKLRAAEEREAALLVELSEIREQNELLEFRLLELEETPVRRDSPDHAVDSGVVSPEPAHKDHSTSKQRSRAVATVIPYTNNATKPPASPALPRKPPLTLQESGIFEEDEDDDENEEEEEREKKEELTERGTQTEAPSGELLQEVQRLQELRARIQERAAKTPVFHSANVDSSPKLCLQDVDCQMVQLAPYQERVRDLEVRLEVAEEAERSHEREKWQSKQREEELLDENYRLTEKVYWLENELRIVRESSPEAAVEDGRGQGKPEDLSNDPPNRPETASCESADRPIVASCEQPVEPQVRRDVTLASPPAEKEKRTDGANQRRDSEEPVVIDIKKSDSDKKLSTESPSPLDRSDSGKTGGDLLSLEMKTRRSSPSSLVVADSVRPPTSSTTANEPVGEPVARTRTTRLALLGMTPSDDQKCYVLRVKRGCLGGWECHPESTRTAILSLGRIASYPPRSFAIDLFVRAVKSSAK